MSHVFRSGWIPTPPGRPRVRYTAALREGTAPVSVDYSKIPAIGMHLNDEWGCCVFAGDANIVEQQTYFGQGREVVVPDDAVLVAYEEVGGFNPNAGPPGSNPTDRGALIPDGLKYLQKTGMCGHKIALYGEIDPTQVEKIKTAIAEFGCVSIGVTLPKSAMTQFENNQPWDYDPNADNSIDGGHAIVFCGYNTSGFLAWTWNRTILVTWAWWQHFGGEAWAVTSADWVSAATGKDPEGVDKYALGLEFQAVTGHNPFPKPPPPPPPPPPEPAPVPSIIQIIRRFFGWAAARW